MLSLYLKYFQTSKIIFLEKKMRKIINRTFLDKITTKRLKEMK